jgi:hypothetical protein
MIILGVVKQETRLVQDHLKLTARVVPAKFLNEAGIIGAAIAAKVNLKKH